MKKSIKLSFKEYIVGILGGLFLLLSRFNFSPFVANFDYSLLGLRLYDPNFIPNDWLVWHTKHIAIAFGYLIYFLQKLGPLVKTVYLAEGAVLIIVGLSIMLLCKRFCKYPLLVFLMMIVWFRIVSPNEIGLGGQYFIKGFLQPLEVAGPLMLLGFALFFNTNYLLAGISFGLAGLFHAAYLSSFAPAILITSIATGVFKNKKKLIYFYLPITLLWGIIAIYILKNFMNSIPASSQTMALMINLRGKYDFMIKNWSLKWSLAWLSWIFLGLFSLGFKKQKNFKPLKIAFFILLATNFFGIIQLIFVKNPTLTLMMFWRSSFMALIFGLIVGLDKAISLVFKKKLSKNDYLNLIVLLFVFCYLYFVNWGYYLSRIHFLWISSIPIAGLGFLILRKVFGYKKIFKKIFFSTVMISMLTIAFVYLKGYFGKTREFLDNYSQELINVQSWIKNNTPKDAILVISPDIQYLRTRAKRAIVVDWLSPPYLPSDLEKWYQRLSNIAGLDANKMVSDEEYIIKGYNRLDFNRAKFLQNKYKADYVLVKRNEHIGNLEGLVKVYGNEEYVLFKIPDN